MELPVGESEDMEMMTRTPGSTTDERRRIKKKKKMLVLIFNIFTSN